MQSNNKQSNKNSKNQKSNQQEYTKDVMNSVTNENLILPHNTKKESLGRNTSR